MDTKSSNKIKWAARISGTIIFLLISPFYVGYGLPLPDPSMSVFENIWLIIVPLFLIGLAIGWKWEKIAGYLITIPIVIGFLVALAVWEDPSILMAIPLIPGILYLIYSYKKLNKSRRS